MKRWVIAVPIGGTVHYRTFQGGMMRSILMRLTVVAVVLAAPVWAASSAAHPGTSTKAPDVGSPEWKALQAEYGEAIRARVLSHWRMPPSVVGNGRCTVEIRQVPGGNVVSAWADEDCPFDEIGRQSLEAAVINAQPMPYRGYEAVFSRSLRMTFEASGR